MEAGRYRVDIAPLDVLDVVNAVEATVAPLAAEKGVAFTVAIDPALPLGAHRPVHRAQDTDERCPMP